MTTSKNPNQNPKLHVEVIPGARNDMLCVPEATEGAGALIWWTLNGSIEWARLEQAWVAAGLRKEDCPAAPSPSLALRLAAQSQAHTKRLARRFEDSWVLADEGADEAADGTRQWKATPVCTVRLRDPQGSDVTWEGDDHVGAMVRAHYHAALVDWPATSVSTWLPTYIGSRCAGITMRECGGVYYIPPAAVPALQQIRQVLESLGGHRMVVIQVLKTDAAVDAILSSLATDTEAAIAAALKDCTTPRKASHRVALLNALRLRLESYEGLLGRKHEEIEEKLTRAERSLALISLSEVSSDEAAA